MVNSRRVEVFGPAYLDRVLRVDRPLFEPSLDPPFDQSTDGEWKFTAGRGIDVIDPSGYALEVEPPQRLAGADRARSGFRAGFERARGGGGDCAALNGVTTWVGWGQGMRRRSAAPWCACWGRRMTRGAGRSRGG